MDLRENKTDRLMKQRKEEFYSLYFSPNINGVVKTWKIGGTGNVCVLHLRENEKCVHYFCLSPDDKRRLGRLDVDGMIILKWISK